MHACTNLQNHSADYFVIGGSLVHYVARTIQFNITATPADVDKPLIFVWSQISFWKIISNDLQHFTKWNACPLSLF